MNDEVKVDNPIAVPEGYEVIPIDSPLFNIYQDKIDTTYSLLWESDEEYLQKAFGFCLRTNGELASVCNTSFVGGGFIAPDILTLKKHRRTGLATIVCTFYVQKSRELGLTPYWNCDAGNDASNSLAQRLGFIKVCDLPILWWHENPKTIASYLKKYHYSVD
ncbi:hypothetical protein PAECIP111802_03387 [Paenibacillus allorhizosphaerae]|uniref:N-acetyltransferase domain-containing protein n=1 Tax=Paenibacillus allorhizosphaerae TaxID=2849866 RepID=A0ABM8VJ63_9BACL|nr:hypothetical protein PAECIP111802_03387 [Paenibacillus allorhizosphaerae]